MGKEAPVILKYMAQYKVLHTKLTMSTIGGTVYVYVTELG